ncbi:MAG: AAA family ATPase [Puniceicoccaceae bacterium]|nr:MAG: AAA family ATPase [Puniceicoccaceae bacterium]
MVKTLEISADAANRLKVKFKKVFPDFSSFEVPGEDFMNNELSYKAKLLQKFQESMTEARMRKLLDQNNGSEIIAKLEQYGNQLAHFTSWNKTFGKDNETRTATLSTLFETTRGPWSGASTLEPLFLCFGHHDLKPDWGALSVALWLFRPEDYFPIKISAFRSIAKSELGLKLAPGAPNPENYAEVMDFLEAFRQVLRKWKPKSPVDVQSVLYALSYKHLKPMASPFDRIFIDRKQAHEIFALFREGMERLPLDLNQPDDPRIAISLLTNGNASATPEQIQLVFGKWPLIRFAQLETGDHGLEFKCLRSLALESGEILEGENNSSISNADDKEVAWLRIKPEEMEGNKVRKVFHDSMQHMGTQFRDWNEPADRRHHIPELFAALKDTKKLKALLDNGLQESHSVKAQQNDSQSSTRRSLTFTEAMGDLFMPVEDFQKIVETLRRKKNLILQGAPGTGKTYAARRIATALMNEEDSERVCMIQFHQSYSYEDFIQGWRPNEMGGFSLRNGHFKVFCERAAEDPAHPYVFIIDEINRGNLSRIFGEMMVLLEVDKRKERMPLTYQPDTDFEVPENVHLLGLMNTADRSLAVVDYALRRRFAFATLPPRFDAPKFSEVLKSKGISPQLIQSIQQVMTNLNQEIAKDTEQLGPGCRIGHSFFVPVSAVSDEAAWYRDVIEWEIIPLLEEYWVDQPDRVEKEKHRLLNP